MNKTETLAYMAGIMDGEGYLGISKSIGSSGNTTYYSRITVHMNQPGGIEILCGYFDVAIKDSNIGGKPYFSFYVTSTDKVIEVIEALMPYLKVKHAPAQLVLENALSRKRHKVSPLYVDGKFRGSSSVPKPIQDYRASLYRKIKQIQGYNSKQTLKV